MNRTDRMLAIVLELQARGVQRGADLAALFEVSTRTIYRDIEALCAAGVPVVAEAGRGYWLHEGFFLPPLHFSAAEAAMLLLGSTVIAQSFDAEYQRAAQDASRKIAAVLPAHEREEVHALQRSFRFIGGDAPEETERLAIIRRAIGKQRPLRFHYHARRSAQPGQTQRTVDPYELARVANAWHLIGWCHDRQAIRTFRLARMHELALLHGSFVRPTEPVPANTGQDRTITVLALFDHNVADWVREGRLFYAVAEEQRADGLLVTLRVRHEDDVLAWLLGWGGAVRVLAPATLQQRMAAAARAILARHAPEPH